MYVYGGQIKEKQSSPTTYAFSLDHNQWFKIFYLEPPPPRTNCAFANLQDKTLIFGGHNLAKGVDLSDLWCLDTSFVPQELTDAERLKKKELTGAVWTNLDYKVQVIQDKDSEQIEYDVLERQKAKQHLINSKESNF